MAIEGQQPQHRLGRRAFLLGGAAVAGALAITAATNREGIASAIDGLLPDGKSSDLGFDMQKFIEGSHNLLPTLPDEELKRLANIPKAEPIGERYSHTVSPQLQERARRAGYHLVYQGDPNDQVGRTVMFGQDRSDVTYYDIGFGWWFSPEAKSLDEVPGFSITGSFKGWMRPNNVASEDKSMYMLLENPTNHQEFLVRTYEPGEYPVWILDDLDMGPDPGRIENSTVREEAWSRIKVPLVDNVLDSKSFPKPTVEINSGVNLDKILRPGDIVKAYGTFNRFTNKSNEGVGRDELGVPVVGVTLRRFGGPTQLQQEIL